MAFEFKLPDIGEGVVEGEIVEWLVKEGDSVAEDQPLVAVMTDKATVEIPSPKKGKVVKLGAKAGEIVKVGAVLVTLDAEGGTAPAPAPAKAEAPKAAPAPAPAPAPAAKAPEAPKAAEAPRPAAPAPAPAPPPAAAAAAPAAPAADAEGDAEGVIAAPATRKLARELGVDIHGLKGTGPRGRVTKEDVESAAAAPRAPRLAAPAAASAAPAAAIASSAPAPASPPVALLAIPHRSSVGERTETREPVRGLRKKIAERMVKSKREAPHFAYVDHFDATELVALRARLKPQAERYGVGLTYMPFILKALVPCLKEFPIVNSMLDEATGDLVYKHYYNIGVAADTDRGLTVPVVHDVDRKSILEIAAEITELVERARAGRSRLEDLQGGTFTVTSTGNIGGLFATPIINFPEVAILGVPKIKRLPWVVKEQVVVRDVLHLALCFDHRVVDGAVGARFTNRLIEYLSEPSRIFLELA